MSRRFATSKRGQVAIPVADHALERARERAPGSACWPPDALRHAIAAAVVAELHAGHEEPHWYPGQTRCRIQLCGAELVAVLAPNTTGVGVGREAGGAAVVTILAAADLTRGSASAW
jgi:hypothetical protein